jgi:hypothetical protein
LRAQPGDRDRDQPLDRCLRSQAGGGVEGVQAVAGQPRGLDIVPDVAGLRGLGEQVRDEAEQVLLSLDHVLGAVQERRHVIVVVLVAAQQRVGAEDGLEPLTGIGGLVPDVGEVVEVAGDLALVPGLQDGLDVGEVLVQGRPPDAGSLGYLRHRY